MRRLVLAATLLLCAQPARAEEPAATTVYATNGCKSASWAQGPFLELLRVELASEHVRVESSDAPTKEATLLTALPDACAESSVGATLTLTRGDDRRERHVDLANVAPNARARVLALAAAELLRTALAAPLPTLPPPTTPVTLHITIDTVPAPAPVTEPVPAPAPATRTAPPAPLLSLLAEARTFPRGAASLFGARLGLSLPLLPIVALTFDLGAAYGGAHDPLGDVASVLVGGSVGVALVGGTPAIRVLVGPRIELDWAHFAGNPASPTTLASSADSPAALALLSATAHVAVSGHVWATVGVDAGLSLYGYGAQADGRQVTDISGPTLGIRIGLAWGPRVP